ncbi:hypothetical protein Tco_0837815 [Tanacetum coccineum]
MSNYFGNGIVVCFISYISVLFCPVDTAYWCDLIRRIELVSASTMVEIDLTWSLGLVSVELASVEAQISLIKLDFSSCLFADSLINLLRVSFIDAFVLGMKGSRCSFGRIPELLLYIPLLENVNQIECSKLLQGFSLLP